MDERFEEGIRLFNVEEFFDAHEVWEDLWQEYRGDDRAFLQGLIQLAAGFYHAQCLNPKGTGSQLSKGLSKIRPFCPVHSTIRSGVLVETVSSWLVAYEQAGPEAGVRSVYPRIERLR